MTRMLKRAFEEASQLADTQQDVIAQVVLAQLDALPSQPDDAFLEAHRNAPIDDEPTTDEDLEALREGLEELSRGATSSQDEIRRELLGAS